MSSCSVVVLISGNGTNLQAIIDGVSQKEIPITISAVISNKADAYGLERAKKAGIPCHILSKARYDSVDAYDKDLIKLILPYQPRLIVLAGFMRILSAGFIQSFSGKILNIHPSLLPKYKGLNTHQRALDAQELWHGCSVHFVTETLDDGPVILHSKVAVKSDETVDSLTEKVHQQEYIIYPTVIRWFAENRLKLYDNNAYYDDQLIAAGGLCWQNIEKEPDNVFSSTH